MHNNYAALELALSPIVDPSSPLVPFSSFVFLSPSLVVPFLSPVVPYPPLVPFSPLVSYILVAFSSSIPHTPLTPCSPATSPPRQLLGVISLPPEDNPSSNDPFEGTLKSKWNHVEKMDLANMKKLRFLLMTSLREEETV